jgi:hypothetical protein
MLISLSKFQEVKTGETVPMAPVSIVVLAYDKIARVISTTNDVDGCDRLARSTKYPSNVEQYEWAAEAAAVATQSSVRQTRRKSPSRASTRLPVRPCVHHSAWHASLCGEGDGNDPDRDSAASMYGKGMIGVQLLFLLVQQYRTNYQ